MISFKLCLGKNYNKDVNMDAKRHVEKKLDGIYIRMLYSTKEQLYGHLPPIIQKSKLDEQDMRGTVTEVRTNL